MPAFELAYQIGADGIETDVQLTRDGVPILIHDEMLNRTTNGNGFVHDYTLKELKKLDAGSWFSQKYTKTRLVTLSEFLDWVKDKPLKLNIELKNNVIDYKHLEKIVYDYLVQYKIKDRTIISSFNPNSIKRFKKIAPEINTAFLTSQRIRNLIHYIHDLGATALHAKYRLLNGRLVTHCHKNHYALRIYTVNQPAKMMKCYKLGCDAIFTDVPHVALEYRELFKHNYHARK